MTTDYDLFCRTCGSAAHFDNVSNQETMFEVRDEMKAFAAAEDVEQYVGELDMGRGVFRKPCGFFSWCAKHLGHDVVVRDEYGVDHDKCESRTVCPCCGQSARCVLAHEHVGPCRVVGS